jgi:hypothetical protein
MKEPHVRSMNACVGLKDLMLTHHFKFLPLTGEDDLARNLLAIRSANTAWSFDKNGFTVSEAHFDW